MIIKIQIYINGVSWGHRTYENPEQAKAGFEDFLGILEEDYEQELEEQSKSSKKGEGKCLQQN